MFKKLIPLCIIILPIGLSACNLVSDYDKQVRKDDNTIKDYLSSNSIVAQKTTSGVYYEPIIENDDGKQPLDNDVATIRYTLKLLPGGEVIETYTDEMFPVRFSLSPESIEPRVLVNLIGFMREGETYRFFIPSYRAFSDYRHPDLFTVNSNFILDMELVSLRNMQETHNEEVDYIRTYVDENHLELEESSNGLFYKDLSVGSGANPGTHSHVRFHFTISYLDDTLIATSTNSNPLVEPLNQNRLPSGVEQAIRKMKVGGTARAIVPSSLAFGKSFQVIPQTLRQDWVDTGNLLYTVLPFTPVLYEIELHEIL